MGKRKVDFKGQVINLPGVNISELLEFEEFLPKLRLQLARVMYIACIIAQIRLYLLKFKPREVEALESVNFYIRNGLSKSEPMLYISAGVALRKTAFKYVDDPDGEMLTGDHLDLMMNTTGRASTKGGIKVAMSSERRLRENRRGLMLQTVGSIQAATIHSPLKFSHEVQAIKPSDFLDRLPFNTKDMNLEEITEFYMDVFISKMEKDEDIVFVDALEFPNIPLEDPFRAYFKREHPQLPDISETIKNSKNLTKLQKLALKQFNEIKEG